MTFRRVLIANRGEIAERVIRTCRRLGIETVLATSEADRDSVPARVADHVVVIGAAPSSYLNIEAVVAAAVRVRADALHPGYGFLSENVALAQACERVGVVFVGPSVQVLRAVGDKLSARRHAQAAGLPVVPGDAASSASQAREVADRIGFPLLVKAVGGGGGRGMKLVASEPDLSPTLAMATAEAQAAFGDPRVYIERYVRSGRHIEVQVLGDGKRVVHLGDRDCSVQRRYQKLFEEAPAPLLPGHVRAGLRSAATALARELRYQGLGTVEFLYDRTRGEFYFLEMNARIQVEHPVTEMVTGVDLVAEQIAVAQGERCGCPRTRSSSAGTRWSAGSTPRTGRRGSGPSRGASRRRSSRWATGSGWIPHIQSGSVVPPYYDSLLAKLVVHGVDRDDAVERMRHALRRTRIGGIATTVDLHRALLADRELVAGGVDTMFFARFFDRHRPAATPASISAAGISAVGA